jgi:hypothetical protein
MKHWRRESLAHLQCAFRLFCYPGVPHVARDMRHPGLWNPVPSARKSARGSDSVSSKPAYPGCNKAVESRAFSTEERARLRFRFVETGLSGV